MAGNKTKPTAASIDDPVATPDQIRGATVALTRRARESAAAAASAG